MIVPDTRPGAGSTPDTGTVERRQMEREDRPQLHTSNEGACEFVVTDVPQIWTAQCDCLSSLFPPNPCCGEPPSRQSGCQTALLSIRRCRIRNGFGQ